MEKYNKLYQVMSRIGGYPQVSISQKDNNEFKIRINGEFMKSFMRLGEIQEEIKNDVGEDFEMRTVYGEGQDALFIFIEKEE